MIALVHYHVVCDRIETPFAFVHRIDPGQKEYEYNEQRSIPGTPSPVRERPRDFIPDLIVLQKELLRR